MIDLHCHILPGLDDGPDSFSESVAMAELAAADGVSRIVATPHINHGEISAALIRERVDQLNDLLAERGVALEIIQGAEISYKMAATTITGYTLNQSPYVLVEFPHTHLPRDAGQLIFALRAHGFWPIIAHPERNPSVIRNPERLFELLGDEVFVQITAASIAGQFGGEVRKCAAVLLKKKCVHFLASDGHSATWRRPILSEGVKAAGRIAGKEQVEKMVSTNPMAVLSGLPLPSMR